MRAVFIYTGAKGSPVERGTCRYGIVLLTVGESPLSSPVLV
jgi:hypothetical protein